MAAEQSPFVRRSRILYLSSLLLALSGCEHSVDPFPPGGGTTDTNQRPSVALLPGSGSSGTISISYVVQDKDDDAINVSLYYSNDGGAIYTRCTPASGTNPQEPLESGGTYTFEWDSATDLPGDNEVTLRLVPNDGKQDGEAVLSDTFPISNQSSGGGGGGGEDAPDFSQVGNHDEFEPDSDGVASLVLNDGTDPARDNRNEEFLLLLANAGESGTGFSLTPSSSSASKGTVKGPGRAQKAEHSHPKAEKKPLSPTRARVKAWAERSPAERRAQLRADELAESQPSSRSTVQNVGQSVQEFRVRADLDDEGVYNKVVATLAAVGTYVSIWVDRDVPIDWDYDCTDSLLDEPDRAGRETYGFDTCDLSSVADIFDKNIIVNLNNYFGELSDVDGSGALNVLITPVLNQLTITNADEDDDDRLIEVYADPEVDLTDYHPSNNPGSNYQELIYLSAPDPAGYFNPLTGGGGEDAVIAYVTATMGANIAIATSNLISYNLHVVEGEGDPEEDWLNDGLGLLAADLTGFGSVVYDDVAFYLDATHLFSLTDENAIDDVNDRGMQYLFCRWLVEALGPDILPLLLSNPETGINNVESVLQGYDPEATFESYFLYYLAAINLTGLVNEQTNSYLVTDLPMFAGATVIPPGSAEYYGAEQYQQGINIRGINKARARNPDGTLTEREVRLNGADSSTFAAGVNFFGYLSGNYGAIAIRIGGLLSQETTIKLVGTSADLVGMVVRLNDIDPSKPPVVIEQVFGSLATDIIPMSFDELGKETVGLGEIDTAQKMTLLDGSSREVSDTDLYQIDLSTASSPLLKVYITADRTMTGTDGTIKLDDLMMAVIPAGDVPDPTALQGRYSCSDSVYSIYYPGALQEYMFAQYVLNPKVGMNDNFNPVGTVSTDPTVCNYDQAHERSIGGYEQNDDDEPQPETLVDQIRTFQIQYLDYKSTVRGFYPYTTAYSDAESLDSDDDPDYELSLGVGGRYTSTGEEAHLVVDLPAGEPENKYIIVVGGEGGAVGPYELSVRVLVDP
ncbi:MAG: hypothetical protein ACKO6N_26750 [Myxococcota bacterium]